MKIFCGVYSLFVHSYRHSLVKKILAGGGKIGKHTVISNPFKTKIDITRPYLLEIGDYCVISSGVTILTHDYSLSTLRRVYGEWIGEGGVTHIGDNCFIGMDSVILMGTHIGNNTIIGAGSVVRGNIPDNVVIAGNPARVICSLEDHYKKRKNKSRQEAILCAQEFYKKKGKIPKPNDLGGFKFLFCPRSKYYIDKYGLDFSCSTDEPKEVLYAFYRSEPVWENFDAFLKDCELPLQ